LPSYLVGTASSSSTLALPARTKIGDTLVAMSPEPVKHVINTHWHFDHTEGNEWLHSVGAKIVGHDQGE
jgi:glyoxylase-like metal-dependent hydrolase (beta-lactamase superfamily II)